MWRHQSRVTSLRPSVTSHSYVICQERNVIHHRDQKHLWRRFQMKSFLRMYKWWRSRQLVVVSRLQTSVASSLTSSLIDKSQELHDGGCHVIWKQSWWNFHFNYTIRLHIFESILNLINVVRMCKCLILFWWICFNILIYLTKDFFKLYRENWRRRSNEYKKKIRQFNDKFSNLYRHIFGNVLVCNTVVKILSIKMVNFIGRRTWYVVFSENSEFLCWRFFRTWFRL